MCDGSDLTGGGGGGFGVGKTTLVGAVSETQPLRTEEILLDEVRLALDLDPDVPVMLCDARERESSKEVLINLLEHVRNGRGLTREPQAVGH